MTRHLNLFNPSDSQIASMPIVGSGSVVNNFTLPSTGTYTLELVPNATDVGHVSVEMFQYSDLTGTLATSTPTTMNNNYPGQTDSLTFSGTANQIISITFSNGSYPSYDEHLNLLDPSGSQIASTWVNGSGGVTNNFTLTSTGTYTLQLVPSGWDTGHVTVELVQYSDLTGTLATSTPTTMNNNYPGQTDSLTFSGTAGATISIDYSGGTYPSYDEHLNLFNPSGSQIASTWVNGSGVVANNMTLPSTGTYTLELVPNATDVGHVSVEMFQYSDLTGTLATSTPTTMNNNYPGQTDSLTFSGTANQIISITFSNGSYPSYDEHLNLLDPSSSQIASVWVNGSGTVVSSSTLSTTGTYTLQLVPSGWDTGHVTVNLTGS